jgi:mono/diheme cytochrome c family protein
MQHNGLLLRMVGGAALLLIVGLLLGMPQAQRPTPVAAQEGDMAAAEALFNEQCAICHGVRGTGELGPPLNVPPPPEVRNLPPAEQAANFLSLVRNGIPGKMPGFTPEQVSDAQSEQIRAYLKTLQDIPPGEAVYDVLAPVTPEQPAGRVYFPETQHSVGDPFLSFWQQNGGLQVFGYPLSEEYLGVSPATGAVYRMQLFERARFELHPDQPAGEQVKLALLGAEELDLHTHFLGQHTGD